MRTASPSKPFDDFAWHWASVQPTEGLLDPPVFFGVLRALHKCEGEQKSSAVVRDALKSVEDDVAKKHPKLHLARPLKRNLLRNSGQYWQALGLLEPHAGEVHLTSLGQRVADGRVPIDDFVAATVRNLELPNRRIQSAGTIATWDAHRLKIKPLRLLLEILLDLPPDASGERFITVGELCRIAIPLSAQMVGAGKCAVAIRDHRSGKLNLSRWPNCTPKSNDKRSAAEFLLFLSGNGLLRFDRIGAREEWRFVMEAPHAELAQLILDHPVIPESIETEVSDAVHEQVSIEVARTRRMVEQIHRPNQAQFRRSLLRDHGQRCPITGETDKAVLVAAHIVPVEHRGDDSSGNGLPLRADIHLLFDAGLLKIHPDGTVMVHHTLRSSPSYASLPARIALPPKVNRKNLEWRLRSL